MTAQMTRKYITMEFFNKICKPNLDGWMDKGYVNLKINNT